jgi:hypothetical protein
MHGYRLFLMHGPHVIGFTWIQSAARPLLLYWAHVNALLSLSALVSLVAVAAKRCMHHKLQPQCTLLIIMQQAASIRQVCAVRP